MTQTSGSESAASLRHYDGSTGYLVDSNVWIDCMDASSPWHGWAIDQLQACSELGELHINIVVYAELLVPEPDPQSLGEMLDVYGTKRSELPWQCAALAAKAFSLYRKRGGARRAPLPDFFIGAHAAVSNLAVLTRDEAPYRSYFPRLRRVVPA